MRLSLSTHLLVHGRLDGAALESVRCTGHAELEVWLAEPHVPWRSASRCEQFRSALEDHGLRAASVHLPFYPSVPELKEQGRRWSVIHEEPAERAAAVAGAADGLRAAAVLGAECAVLHLGWQRDPWPERAHGWAREAVAALLPVAREAGVRLLLENIISEGTRVHALLALLAEVDPEAEAGLCLDLGHAHVHGGVLTELRAALPRLAHLHVHDNGGLEDEHLAPGRGSIPWDPVITELRRAGFTGYGALELRDPSRGAASAAQLCLEAAADLLPFRARWEDDGTP